MGISTVRAIVFCLILVQLFACQQAPQPLPVTELHFPDPERDAIKSNGIREVIALCVSSEGCFDSPMFLDDDTFNITYYDTMGNLLYRDPISMFGALDEHHWYNDLGWEIIDYEYNDHGYFYLYRYEPAERRLFQYYYMQPPQVVVAGWYFDGKGRPIRTFNYAAETTFGYDSLGRITQKKEVYSSSFVAQYGRFFGSQKITEYQYQGSTPLLTKMTYSQLDTNNVAMRHSYTKHYDSRGLPKEQHMNDGRVLNFTLHTTTAWSRDDVKGRQFFPEPFNK